MNVPTYVIFLIPINVCSIAQIFCCGRSVLVINFSWLNLKEGPGRKRSSSSGRRSTRIFFLTGGETGMKMENLNRDRFLLWRFSSSFLARFSSRFFPNCACVTLKNIRDPKPNGHIFSFLTPPTFFLSQIPYAGLKNVDPMNGVFCVCVYR